MEELTLPSGKTICIRPYRDSDFSDIQRLNREAGWTNLASNDRATQNAWQHSNVAFVALAEHELVGYIRGLTDQHVTLYICELMVKDTFQRMGIGSALLHYVHGQYPSTRLELLASNSSRSYYEHLKFRTVFGFRKLFSEP